MVRAALTRSRAPLAIALLFATALALNRSGADFALARLFFDEAARAFRWRDDPLLALVLHDAAKWLSVALSVALAVLLVATRRPRLSAWRSAVLFTLVASLAAALAVSLLKSRSAHSCPWDLRVFGGAAAYFPLLGAVPADPGPGRCVPSGHASTGFMWIAAFYAVSRAPLSTARRAAWRRLIGAAVLAFGSAVSLAQIARGAHFASHVLITAALCWAVAWGLDRVLPAPRG